MQRILNTATPWVNAALSAMTLDEKLAQLLHAPLHPTAERQQQEQDLAGLCPGGIFLFPGSAASFGETADWLQARSRIPVLISSDLENGAGRMIEDATIFPDLMGLAAADDDSLAYAMGQAAAREGRGSGVHWSFGPVVDVNVHPHSPIVSTRGLGDDPERIARLARQLIRGMQENGMCATAKHFPGDGFDDRDQHICTTINPLSKPRWDAFSGRMFREAIDCGVWSIMIGHIALPSVDSGDGGWLGPPPATISKRLITDLLRGEMGFDGVIITDAISMGGLLSHGTYEEVIPVTIEAGCDMVLFASMKRDLPILRRAVEEGRLSAERVDEAVRRVLALKERIGLHEEPGRPSLREEEKGLFRETSREIAERAVTLVHDRRQALPLRLGNGSRILSVHAMGDSKYSVSGIDDLLRETGAEVTSLTASEDGTWMDEDEVRGYDAVLLHMVFGPSWMTNRIRPAGNFMRTLHGFLRPHHPKTIMVSYGSPYHGYDLPQAPALLNAYSPDGNTQRAVVKILAGEFKARGESPVDLSRPDWLRAKAAEHPSVNT